MKKVLVFASGNGSNFQAIVEYFKNKDAQKGGDKRVVFELLVDKENCYACTRAENLGIKYHYVPFNETENFLKNADYSLYVLAGYMRILPAAVLNYGTFINIHPSLLPKYKGKNAIEQAYNEREKECGVSVHYVNEEVDSGEIIEQQAIEILPDISLEELEKMVHGVEHKIYPRVIEKVLFGG